MSDEQRIFSPEVTAAIERARTSFPGDPDLANEIIDRIIRRSSVLRFIRRRQTPPTMDET